MSTAPRHGALGRGLPFILLLVLSVGYVLFFGNLSILKLESFNASVNDLGYFNELFWITIHGGPAAWAAHVEPNFYAGFPWQTGVFVVLLPVYMLWPSPGTLLIVQTVALGSGSIPAFFLSRKYGLSSWASFAIGGVYLLNYQVQSVNLNDFHIQCLYPLIFLSMILFYEYGWTWAFLGAGVLSLLTNPLTLALTIGFLLAILLRGAPQSDTLRYGVRKLMDWFRTWSAESILLSLAVVLVVFELASGSITGYHLGSTAARGGTQTYYAEFSVRMLYLIMAFAPFLGVALLERETAILAAVLAPFLALGDLSYFGFIGRQDSIEFSVVALWGLILFASRHPTRDLYSAISSRIGASKPRAGATRFARWPNATVLGAIAMTVVLFLGLSPVSPWNHQPQLVGDVDENPANFDRITPADHFLDSAIRLIPPNASVLTQNNIPQLTGRYTFQWAFPGKTGINVTNFAFILSDESTNSFAQYWYNFMRPYVESAVDSHRFGIVALGYGILLLQRGYRGSAEITGPLPYSPSNLELATGYLADGLAIHEPANNSTFWYGPYVDLPPGNYTATYQVMVRGLLSPASPIIRVGVSNYSMSGTVFYASTEVFGYNFAKVNFWVNLTLNFSLDRFTRGLELPGLNPTSAAEIELGGVVITLGHTASAPRVTLPVTFQASSFLLDSGIFQRGYAVHDGGDNSTFWYGPYADLPRGAYTATFQLEISAVAPSNQSIIVLAIDSELSGSPVYYNVSTVYSYDFAAVGVWQNFTLSFQLEQSEYQLEFKGISPTSSVELLFGGVVLA